MKKILDWFFGSFFRSIGRIVAYLLIGYIVVYLLQLGGII